MFGSGDNIISKGTGLVEHYEYSYGSNSSFPCYSGSVCHKQWIFWMYASIYFFSVGSQVRTAVLSIPLAIAHRTRTSKLFSIVWSKRGWLMPITHTRTHPLEAIHQLCTCSCKHKYTRMDDMTSARSARRNLCVSTELCNENGKSLWFWLRTK